MLVREKDSITRMIATQYMRVQQEMTEVAKSARETAIVAYLDQPHITKELDEVSLYLGQKVKDAVLSAATGRMTNLTVGNSTWMRQMKDMGLLENKSPVPGWGSAPLNSMVDIALNTSTKKWAAIQSGVYSFAADCNKAHTVEELETEVKKFLAYLA